MGIRTVSTNTKSPAGLIFLSLALMLLVSLATPRLAAGGQESSVIATPGPIAASATEGRTEAEARALFRELETTLRSLPRWVSAAFIVLGLIPLFWGWRFLRTVVSIFFAIAFARIAFSLAHPHIGSIGAMIVSVVASMIGGSLGWYARAALISLEGALVLGVILFALGDYLAGSGLGLGLGLTGALVGLALGWKAAPYLEAIEAALIGATLIGMGVVVLRPVDDPRIGTWLMIGAAGAAAAVSIIYQFKHIPEWVASGKMERRAPRRRR